MNKNNIQISDEAAKIADLVEQIQSTNSMITLHQDDEIDFMLRQYALRKSKLVEELKSLLQPLKVELNLTYAA